MVHREKSTVGSASSDAGSATHDLRGQHACRCRAEELPTAARRVVLTGGPGGGKTAVLEAVRRQLCRHVVVLPEAASLLFSGGFPRGTGPAARRAAQRAIFRVQDELEQLALEENRAAIILCDRGVIDGAAYWPGTPDGLFAEVGTTRAEALARYAAVIHLRVPGAEEYDTSNRLRVESAVDAAAIDARIAAVWSDHPERVFVDAQTNFVHKLARAIAAIEAVLPPCCRR